MWVLDGTSDPSRIRDAKELLHSILDSQALDGASLLIYLNKTDLTGCISPDDVYKAWSYVYAQMYIGFFRNGH